MRFSAVYLLGTLFEVLYLGLVPLLHLFELTPALDPRILVFSLTLPCDTFGFLNVVVNVALYFVAHPLYLAFDLLFLLAFNLLASYLLISQFFFV